jgi:acetyl-CoA carboxylase biotin carboxyl carrier protein
MKETWIRKLIQLVENSNIHEIEVTRWGQKIRITKSPQVNSHQPDLGKYVTSKAESTTYPPPTTNPESAEKVETLPPPETKEEKNITIVRSPIVGTFYSAPSPDAEPFVEVGSRVEVGTTLCIIEAMKIMNEIESEVAGDVVDILVENAQPVEYNQPLFKILVP